jgi:hypothetical protein
MLSIVDSKRVPSSGNTSEFMAQLQNMENSMLLLHSQSPHSSSSTAAKSSHASKRRTVPLF